MSPRAAPRVALLATALADPLAPAARRPAGRAVFALLLVFAAFWDLGGRSLHDLDLPRFAVIAEETVATGSWLVPPQYGEAYANKPPLYPWLVAVPTAIAGEATPLGTRWPCALGFLLLAFATAAWARHRTGSAAAGRVAALLVATTYVVVLLRRESRPDMLATGLSVAGAFLVDRAASGRGRPRDALGAGLVLGLAVLAKGPATLLLPFAAWLLPSEGRSTRARFLAARPLVVLSLLLLVVLAWLVPAAIVSGPAWTRALVVDQVASRLAGTANKVEPATYYLVRFLDAGLPWTWLYLAAFALPFTRAGRRALAPVLSLVGAAAVTLAVFSLVPTKQVRYVAAVFAPLAVVGGHLVARHLLGPARPGWTRFRAHLRVASVPVAAGLVAAGAFVRGAPPLLLLPVALVLAVSFGLAPSPVDPRGARRASVGSLLVLGVVLLSAAGILRDRFRVREGDRFQNDLEVLGLTDRPFVVVSPLVPDRVWPAVRGARIASGPEAVPPSRDRPRLDVLCLGEDRAAVEHARGDDARLLGRWPEAARGEGVVLLRFGGG